MRTSVYFSTIDSSNANLKEVKLFKVNSSTPRIKLTLSISVLIALFLCQVTFAAEEAFVSLGRKTSVGARALALSDAVAANPGDYATLYYNPAGMTQIGPSQIGLNVGYNYWSESVTVLGAPQAANGLESVQLNALQAVLSGKDWAMGFGIMAPTQFDELLAYQAKQRNYQYLSRGSLKQFRTGLAWNLSPLASIGVAASALFGQEKLEIQDSVTIRYLEEYSGFNLEPGILITLTPNLRLGASAVLFEALNLRDTYQIKGGASTENEFSIKHPLQTKLGLALNLDQSVLSLDWQGDYWSSYSYSEVGAVFENHPDYPNRHRFSLGLEHEIPRSYLQLRSGFGWEVVEGFEAPTEHLPFRIGLGLGFDVDSRLHLDLGYQYKNQNERLNGGLAGELLTQSSHHQVMGNLILKF